MAPDAARSRAPPTSPLACNPRRLEYRRIDRMLTANLATLLGQPAVSEFLRGIVLRGRYANAYLFHGPHGVGKTTAALAFARAALCERVHGAASVDREPSLFGDAPLAFASATG